MKVFGFSLQQKRNREGSSFDVLMHRTSLTHTIERICAPELLNCFIYAVIAFAAMSYLLYSLGENEVAGTAIFLWSWINYKMLTGGKDTAAETGGQEPAAQDGSYDNTQF